MENQFMEIVKNAYGMTNGRYIIRVFRGEKVETGTEIQNHIDNHAMIQWDHNREQYAVQFDDCDHVTYYSPKVLQHYMDNWHSGHDGFVFTWQMLSLPFNH